MGKERLDTSVIEAVSFARVAALDAKLLESLVVLIGRVLEEAYQEQQKKIKKMKETIKRRIETADLGEVAIGPSVKVGYLSQQGWEGDPEQTVLDAFREEVPVAEGKA